MSQSKRILFVVLLFPIVALAALATYKKALLSNGDEVVLPISGYDPRDLLAGHYLIYRIDYGIAGLCSSGQGNIDTYVCLAPRTFAFEPIAGCRQMIRGRCNYARFEAGIERFYVPEAKAPELERQIRDKTASIVLSVSPSGSAQVKDLLVNGVSWKKLGP